MSIPSIGVNSFVKRQTRESPFSCYEKDFLFLPLLVRNEWHNSKPGYKDGVRLVPVPPAQFLCGIVKVQDGTALYAKLVTRREGEEPYIQVTAKGDKQPAKYVDIVCYSREVLGVDAETGRDWEIVSINARPTSEEEPLTPITMARNMLELPGGTSAKYSAEEFAKSIVYWSKRAMCHVES